MSNPGPSSASPTAPVSPVAAVAGTFTSPSATFARLLARPTWWLPFLLSLAFTAGVFAIASQKMDMDRTVREALEKRASKTGQVVSPESVTRQVQMTQKLQPYILGGVVVFGAAAFFVTGLVLWGAARAMGGVAAYAQILAVWAHASLPLLVGAILAIPIFWAVADGSLTQTGAQQIVRSNVGAFLPESAPAALRAAASSLDVFAIWALVLLVVGFRRIRGLSRGAATATPVVLWGVWVALKTGWAALFG